MAETDPSYIDYETFLDPDFSPITFANSLVLATNNPSDTPIDLSTPLSRVLFDVQEIDTHVHNLTTKSALPLLNYTREQDAAGQRIVEEVDAHVSSLTDGYQRLEKEIIGRHETADQVRVTVERLWQTVELGRAVSRCLTLGRQLEVQMAEVGTANATKREDHRAMMRAATTLATIRSLLASNGPGQEGENLSRVHVVTNLQSSLLSPAENTLLSRGQQIVREFAMSSLAVSSSAPATFAQTEETKARTISALLALRLLSPQVQLAALQAYLRTSLTSSLASIARSLSNLPSLDRTLLEVSARCQNIVALESLLETIKPLPDPSSSSSSPHEASDQAESAAPVNLLDPLLISLDTSSLPSYFWRSLAEGLAGRVSDLVAKGGVHARTLRSQREKVRESLRECVFKGSQGPGGGAGAGGGPGGGGTTKAGGIQGGSWEREAAVMVGSILGPLGGR